MIDAPPARQHTTPQGWLVDEYRLPHGGVLLVPVIPDWEIHQLRQELDQRGHSDADANPLWGLPQAAAD